MTRPLALLGYPSYALATFLSAFLLFQIEPIAGKRILPYLGGGASVWATVLLFFTIVVFAGYLYVYALTRYSEQVQKYVHMALLVLAGASVIFSLEAYATLFPGLVSVAHMDTAPYAKVFLALATSIGLPFFALSATGPLLQYWYRHSSGKEPYRLYAVSNAGSLLALLTFPFVFEPHLTLHTIERVWATCFLLSGFGLLCIALFGESYAAHHAHGLMPRRHAYRVVTYSALASALLVAVTTQLTHVVAPVPLLWVAPLSLYLISFIVAFSGWRSIYTPLLVAIASIASYAALRGGYDWTGLSILIYNALLFGGALICHTKVYELRPRELPSYYVAISFGGMMGALLTSLAAPLIFNDVLEFPIGLSLAAIVSLWLMPIDFFPRIMTATRVTQVRILGTALLFILLLNISMEHKGWFIYQSRNFYGVAKVSKDDDIVRLYHDHTLHGLQYLDPARQSTPTSYYTASSGIGRALIYSRLVRGQEPLAIGMIGLGTGSVAAYCAPDDTFTFFEIDQRIVDVAQKYFTYLKNCKGSSVRMGDARLTLEDDLVHAEPARFDVLAVDAFNDDSVPTHLITKEALALYEKHLRSDKSMIVFHASSRYFYISPVVLTLAEDAGLTARVVTSDPSDTATSNSMWVVLAKDPSVFQSTTFKDVPLWYPYKKAPLWTDDFVNVAAAIAIPFTIPFFN